MSHNLKITVGTGDSPMHAESVVRRLLQDGHYDGFYVKVVWGAYPCNKSADGYLFFDPDADELRLENEDEEVMYGEITPASVRRIHIY